MVGGGAPVSVSGFPKACRGRIRSAAYRWEANNWDLGAGDGWGSWEVLEIPRDESRIFLGRWMCCDDGDSPRWTRIRAGERSRTDISVVSTGTGRTGAPVAPRRLEMLHRASAIRSANFIEGRGVATARERPLYPAIQIGVSDTWFLASYWPCRVRFGQSGSAAGDEQGPRQGDRDAADGGSEDP